MGSLIKRHYSPRRSAYIPKEAFLTQSPNLLDEAKEEWVGIYYKGEKVGYSNRILEKLEDGYKISEITFLTISLFRTPREVHIKNTSFLKDDFTLSSFDFSLESENAGFYVKGEIKGRELNLKLKTGQETREENIKLEKIPHLSINLPFYLSQRKLKKGDSFFWPFFDPSTLNESNILVEILDEEPFVFNNEIVNVYKVKETYSGLTIFSWMGKDGTIFKEESPLGFTLLKEGREKAIAFEKGNAPRIDLIASTAVGANLALDNPRQLGYLKMKIRGISLQDYHLQGGRQHLKEDVLEIVKEDSKTMENPSIDDLISYLAKEEKEWERYIKPTLLIQSDHPEITDLAKRIIGNEKKALKAVTSICRWVYDNLEKRITVSVPSALEVLHTRVGDCNEHTVLFTALCRSLKIPAEMNAGLLYHEKKFYYHAWSEVYLGKWISVDPLMNQIPADATHVRLIQGGLMEQAKILNVIGKLSVDILAYR